MKEAVVVRRRRKESREIYIRFWSREGGFQLRKPGDEGRNRMCRNDLVEEGKKKEKKRKVGEWLQ